VAGWRDRYAATASGDLDLLEFARLRRRSLLRALLENGTSTSTCPRSAAAAGSAGSCGTQANTPELAPLAVYDEDELIATVASHDHADRNEILDTGLG